MGFPREYLNFTMWYLRSKEHVTLADNSDYVITATGADFVERKAARNAIVGKLLKPGSGLETFTPRTGSSGRANAAPPARRLLI